METPGKTWEIFSVIDVFLVPLPSSKLIRQKKNKKKTGTHPSLKILNPPLVLEFLHPPTLKLEQKNMKMLISY